MSVTKYNLKFVKASDIKPNPDNPRIIKDDKFKQLVKSIQEFPNMLQLRPLVLNAEGVVLGGNMRLRACIDAKVKDIPVVYAHDLTEEQQREFIIKDNVGYGEWDWDALANNWDTEELVEWGLDLPKFLMDEEIIEEEQQPKQCWFLNIEFTTEHQCQEWYDKLINEGLICKIIQ